MQSTPPHTHGSSPAIRVLFLAANPRDTTRLALGEEYREIDRRVRASDRRDALTLDYAAEMRPDEVAQVVLRHTPTILHFSGHGSADGELLLPDADGRAIAATPEAVAGLFAVLAPQVGLRGVVLNACYSEALAVALARHVEWVIGASAALPDKMALTFAGAFYEALGYDLAVEQAFELARRQVALAMGVEDPPLVMHRRARESIELDPTIPNPDEAYNPRSYMRRRREEAVALSYLLRRGSPAVLWGPERFGKSTMLQYLASDVLRQEKTVGRVARVDLGLFDEASRQNLDSFLREFALQTVEALGGDDELVADAWRHPTSPSRRLTRALTRVLAGADRAVVLAIDQCDAVLDCAFSNDFFGMLRAWANDPGLAQLRLLLAVSTTPALLNSRLTQSPFNLTTPIHLDDLDASRALELASLHGLGWSAGEIAALMGLVGGHPYLLRVAMFAAAMGGHPLDAIVRDEATVETVFEPFLARFRLRFERQPDLLDALRLAVRDPEARVDMKTSMRLQSAGLVTLDRGRCRVRYRLFERLVR
jgi:AAA-like domain